MKRKIKSSEHLDMASFILCGKELYPKEPMCICCGAILSEEDEDKYQDMCYRCVQDNEEDYPVHPDTYSRAGKTVVD